MAAAPAGSGDPPTPTRTRAAPAAPLIAGSGIARTRPAPAAPLVRPARRRGGWPALPETRQGRLPIRGCRQLVLGKGLASRTWLSTVARKDRFAVRGYRQLLVRRRAPCSGCSTVARLDAVHRCSPRLQLPALSTVAGPDSCGCREQGATSGARPGRRGAESAHARTRHGVGPWRQADRRRQCRDAKRRRHLAAGGTDPQRLSLRGGTG